MARERKRARARANEKERVIDNLELVYFRCVLLQNLLQISIRMFEWITTVEYNAIQTENNRTNKSASEREKTETKI